jgi:hypothetical protein
MRVIMDEIEVGMRIRKLNKDEDDNRFIKIGEGYKGAFIQVDEIKRVYYDEEEEGLLCEIETSPWLPLV